MLLRLETDDCLPVGVVEAFFAGLSNEVATHPAPSPSTPDGLAEWAGRCVLNVLATVHGALQSKGPALPAGAFVNLARVRPARDYRWCLPAVEREQFLEEIPGGDHRWPSAVAEELRAWIEPHIIAYAGAFETGNREGFAWVTDAVMIPAPPPSFAELKDTLGLNYLPDEELGLLCRYWRADVPSLHLPRSLDGLDHAPFRLVTDCAAPHGITLKISTGAPGWPEAVHPACQIPGGASNTMELVA